MKRFLALAGAALALAGVVATAGCQARDRAGRADRDNGTVTTTRQPGSQERPVDVSAVDRDLSDVDSLLTETDTQLSGVDVSPADAD